MVPTRGKVGLQKMDVFRVIGGGGLPARHDLEALFAHLLELDHIRDGEGKKGRKKKGGDGKEKGREDADLSFKMPGYPTSQDSA